MNKKIYLNAQNQKFKAKKNNKIKKKIKLQIVKK